MLRIDAQVLRRIVLLLLVGCVFSQHLRLSETQHYYLSVCFQFVVYLFPCIGCVCVNAGNTQIYLSTFLEAKPIVPVHSCRKHLQLGRLVAFDKGTK